MAAVSQRQQRSIRQSLKAKQCVNCNVISNPESENLETVLQFQLSVKGHKNTRKCSSAADKVGLSVLQMLDLILQISDYDCVLKGNADNSYLCGACMKMLVSMFQPYLDFLSASKEGSMTYKILQDNPSIKRNLKHLSTRKPAAKVTSTMPSVPANKIQGKGYGNGIPDIRSENEIHEKGIKVEVKVDPESIELESDYTESAANRTHSPSPGSPDQEYISEDEAESLAELKSNLKRRPDGKRTKIRNKEAGDRRKCTWRKGTFQCRRCPESFYQLALLNHHEKHHAEGTELCNLCNCAFKTKARLNVHMIKIHPKERVPSKLSETGSTSRTYAECKCPLCGVLFLKNDAAPITAHMVKVHFRCPVCSNEEAVVQFSTHEDVLSHMESAHGPDWKKHVYKCKFCNFKAMKKNQLDRHKNTAHGESRFHCKTCGKKFSNNFQLKQHLTVHTEERPFACDRCPMTFKHKSNLTSHVKIHDGIKFVCDICGFQSSSPANLRKHVAAVHHGQPQTQKKKTVPSGEVVKKRFRIEKQ